MKLYDYQFNAKEQLLKYKVGALFMEAGTGKTRVAWELFNSVKDVDLLVYITPLRTIKTSKGVSSVKDEFAKWGELKCKCLFVGVESIQQSDRIYLEVREEIEKANKAFIIVDESLKIKNAEAKRTKRVIDLGTLSDYKLILNGTPLSRNLMDLWSQMEFLSPKILNMSLLEFKNNFCEYTKVTKQISGKSYQKEFITGYENVDYLYSLVKQYVYECDLHLNVTQNYHILRYEVDEECKEEYKRMKEKYLDDEMLQWKNNNIFIEMTQKMQHAYCCTYNKFSVLDQLFKTIPQEKTILFTKYIDSYNGCVKRYPKVKVLSYQKESFGLNLQDYNHTVYFDKIWDLALRVQSTRRTYRVGQEFNCQYYDMTGNVGLEKMIDENIKKKIGITEYFKKISKTELKKKL